jgi:hypothetical protein
MQQTQAKIYRVISTLLKCQPFFLWWLPRRTRAELVVGVPTIGWENQSKARAMTQLTGNGEASTMTLHHMFNNG